MPWKTAYPCSGAIFQTGLNARGWTVNFRQARKAGRYFVWPGYSKPAGILSDLGSAGLPSHPGLAPEKVQIQFLDNGLKSCLALHGVSGGVQRRGEGRHGHLAGDHGH